MEEAQGISKEVRDASHDAFVSAMAARFLVTHKLAALSPELILQFQNRHPGISMERDFDQAFLLSLLNRMKGALDYE